MSEAETSDALQAQIEAATDARDDVLAAELYRRQQGMTDVFEPETVPVPAVVEAEGDDPPQASTGEMVVATNARDEIATITGEMDFGGNPEHVAGALEAMSVWGEDEVAPLKAKWGSDMGANLGFFQAFALAHPDIHEILVDSGFGDHPAIIEVGAILGRRYATKSGDPSQITTKKAGVKAVEHMNTAAIEAKIEALGDEIDKAQALDDTGKANQLYQEQFALYRQLPGGSDPAIGEGGRVL